MTIAEQLAEQNHRSKLWYVWRSLVTAIAVAVVVISIVLARVNTKATNTANQANETSKVVAAALKESVLSICQSRETTLRTAPQTVKEIRSVLDAESYKARKVCPDLDYAELRRQRLAEAGLLLAGADPQAVASASVGKAGKTGAKGAPGPIGTPGHNGKDGADGRDGKNGARGAAGARGPAGPPGARGATGAQGPAGPVGPRGPSGSMGPRGPIGPPGISIGI